MLVQQIAPHKMLLPRFGKLAFANAAAGLTHSLGEHMPRNSQKPKTPVAPKKPYASAPLGAPLAVKINSPRSITKSASKHERFASAIHAPSPSCLPKPPSSWTRPAAPTLHPAAQLTAPVTPPITLQRSDVVQKQVRRARTCVAPASARPP